MLQSAARGPPQPAPCLDKPDIFIIDFKNLLPKASRLTQTLLDMRNITGEVDPAVNQVKGTLSPKFFPLI